MSGTIWMYSDRMDDWDILFAQKSFITYREGCDYYDLTEKVMTRLARRQEPSIRWAPGSSGSGGMFLRNI